MKSTRTFLRPGAVLALLWFAAFAMPDATAAAKKIPTHEDIWLMKRVGPPQVSPDGRWIVVPVIEPSYDDNTQLSDLWLIDTSARNSSRRLTSTRRPESGVIWSPDSRRIVFSAQRDGDDVPQLYSLDLATGGEAQRLTNLSGGARAPVFAHDGRQLAFVRHHVSGRERRSNQQGERSRRTAARKSNARIFEGFPIRSWDHWLDERQVRIFVQALDEDGLPSGAPRDLLAGTQLAASPGFAGRQTDTGEELDMEFTPDNRALVFAATTNRNQAAPSVHRFPAVRRGRGGRRAARHHPRHQQLVDAAIHARRPHAARRGRRTGRKRLQRVAPRGVLLARTGRTAHRHRRHRLAVNSYAITPNSRTVYFTAEQAGQRETVLGADRWRHGADPVRRG